MPQQTQSIKSMSVESFDDDVFIDESVLEAQEYIRQRRNTVLLRQLFTHWLERASSNTKRLSQSSSTE
ncbi:hypothetical protein N5P37_003795 [Trichoderma harzianum]|nr:hypothetical protein N5P37_003795 [Trichoderma harzianum]